MIFYGACSKDVIDLMLPTLHSLNLLFFICVNQTPFQYDDATILCSSFKKQPYRGVL